MDNFVRLKDGRYLTCSSAYSILDTHVCMFNDFYKHCGCDFSLDANLSVECGIAHDEHGNMHVVMGTKEISRFSNECVDGYAFMSTLVGLFHEARHVNHRLCDFNRHSIDSQCLAVN